MASKSNLLLVVNASAKIAWARFEKMYSPIGDCPVILLNNRLTKTGGRAWLDQGKIDLSLQLLEQYTDNFLYEIIPHELAHFVAWRVFGCDSHGRPWKDVMRQYGLAPNVYHNMVNNKKK